MHRLLRRTHSADFDAPAPPPFAAVPLAAAAPAAPAPADTTPPVATAPVARPGPLVSDRGKTPVPEGALASSSSAPRSAPAPITGILRTAGSTPAPRLALGGTSGALVPHRVGGTSDAGPSSIAGLPPSVAHYFTSKLQLESGNYSRWP
nr:classical arabinogalactan protein 4-like [Aegilops tauschii subsp. strangulata]